MLSRYIARIMARCSDIGKRAGKFCGRGSYFSRNSASFSEALGILCGVGSFEAGEDVLVDAKGTRGCMAGTDAATRASTSEDLRGKNLILIKN